MAPGSLAPGEVPRRARLDPGLEEINKVIRVDQKALGKTPTSKPATYSGPST